jgi:hypothetical protein
VRIDTRPRILDSSGTAALPLATRELPQEQWEIQAASFKAKVKGK